MPSPRLTPSCRIVVDAAAGRTVYVAPGRADRPASDGPGTCPFCAGQEHLTPHEVLRAPADPDLPWSARVIPNRYPIVVDGAAGDVPARCGPDATSRTAHGVHEVIVESPRHDVSILAVETPVWQASWRLAHDRLAVLAARPDLAYGMVFKNSGPAAGASIDHVHSQLVALDAVPPPIAALHAAADGADWHGVLEAASREGRVVAADGELVALVPPAPRQPFETWILPLRPAPWFHAAPEDDVGALSRLSRAIVERLGRVAPGADYNWWLLQAPFPTRALPIAARWRWRLEILPRISPLAGFELGTGCHICIETPVESARRLRAAGGIPPAGPSPSPGSDR